MAYSSAVCFRSKPLAASLTLVLGVAGFESAAATTRTVSNCEDAGPGSLRAAMLAAQNNDLVDLNALSCSTITLTTGALPAAGVLVLDAHNHAGPVIIDGGRYSGRHDRIIVHNGVDGHLYMNYIGVANADYTGPDPRGGCILSSGSVNLVGGVVRNCRVSGNGIAAKGGGIYATGNVAPFQGTTVSNNVASAVGANAYGGGIFAGGLNSDRSSITGNSALASSGFAARGGGVYAFAVQIDSTTLSGNHAGMGGASVFRSGPNPFAPRFIVNSTVSGNTATAGIGGVLAYGSLYVFNCTIAFNSSTFGPAGLYVAGAGNFLQLNSSIVALNSAGGATFDVAAVGQFNGDHNLVTAGLTAPVDTLSSCPRLGHLSDNGFLTKTHALLPGSPAIDTGSNPDNQGNDQREVKRTVGAAPDIGALEVQPGEMFDDVFSSTFDNRCQ
jgi:hypothetical protein